MLLHNSNITLLALIPVEVFFLMMIWSLDVWILRSMILLILSDTRAGGGRRRAGGDRNE